ncbi:MAG: CDP-alcohol phosphatidyltransferase family protein [Deltaproteobacteria bacterium]|nr:CDP-alcohol phosphatidyltransferase family protein [Deltaproteobacteria bacterium]
MTLVARIVGNSPVLLWGLDGATRLRRQLRAAGVTSVIRDAQQPAPDSSVLLLRGDHLFDDRTLRDLVAKVGTAIVVGGAGGSATTVAAHVEAGAESLALAALEGKAAPETIPAVTLQTPASLSSAYVGQLLKSAPPVVAPIRADRVAALERHLFDGSYKGVTDLVTKWVWPLPARAATRLCARLGISPNAVTAMSYVLALGALILFARGHFALGLLLGWVMTFLDTVDGKLARVTVTSTQAGHLFDHILDLFHPPLWYLAWGYGAVSATGEIQALGQIFAAIVGGYVVGRIAEGVFGWMLAEFPMFSWRPLDSYFRLIVARRNPNLLLLSGFALAGLPGQGLVAVAAWTVLSSVVLMVRLVQAAGVRLRDGQLRSWLQEIGADAAHAPRYARPFVSDPAAVSSLMQ